MSFAMTLQNASFFKKLVSTMVILDEPIFRIEKDKLWMRQIDITKAAMIELEIPKMTFDVFECSEPTLFQVKYKDLSGCLKRARDDQFIGLSTDEEHCDKLTITLSEKAIKDFTIPIFATDEDDRKGKPPVKIKEFDTVLKMDTSALLDSINEFKDVIEEHEGLIFISGDGNLVLKAEGEGRGLIITHMLGKDIICMNEGKSESRYGVNFVSEVVVAPSALSGVVKVEFSTNMPVKLTYALPFEGSLVYYLAPRIVVEGVKTG